MNNPSLDPLFPPHSRMCCPLPPGMLPLPHLPGSLPLSGHGKLEIPSNYQMGLMGKESLPALGIGSPFLQAYDNLAAAAGLHYPFSGFAGIDPRRKNATRESTNTLKAWLYEHRKNPYPTKGEKIMLAIITKMTLTQVSTWFANARRRLKKEKKVSWSGADEQRCRGDRGEDGEARRTEGEKEDEEEEEDDDADTGSKNTSFDTEDDVDIEGVYGYEIRQRLSPSLSTTTSSFPATTPSFPTTTPSFPTTTTPSLSGSSSAQPEAPAVTSRSTASSESSKPKIWCLADLATSNNSTQAARSISTAHSHIPIHSAFKYSHSSSSPYFPYGLPFGNSVSCKTHNQVPGCTGNSPETTRGKDTSTAWPVSSADHVTPRLNSSPSQDN